MKPGSTEERLAALEKKGTWLRLAVTVQAVLIASLMCSIAYRRFAANSPSQVTRVHGLIVEDDQGRPRILLGSPFPKVAARTRQDSENTFDGVLGWTGTRQAYAR